MRDGGRTGLLHPDKDHQNERQQRCGEREKESIRTLIGMAAGRARRPVPRRFLPARHHAQIPEHSRTAGREPVRHGSSGGGVLGTAWVGGVSTNSVGATGKSTDHRRNPKAAVDSSKGPCGNLMVLRNPFCVTGSGETKGGEREGR